MGLDISLYTRAEHEQTERHDAEWNALWERKESGAITEAEYDEQRKGVTDWATHQNPPSQLYPEHLFNRRYLRSSYNGSGFNRAVPDFLGTPDEGDLYWIFAPMHREWDGDDGILGPDDVPRLAECRARAELVAEWLRKCDPLRVEAIHAPMLGSADHMWSKLPNDDEVLAWYRDEQAEHAAQDRNEPFGEGYSNAKGTVFGFTQGMEVLAVTLGRDVLRQPAPMIVYRSAAIVSYVQSAEITAEFCDEAISLIEADGSAYVSWSG
jgi:hypothetical protein